MKLNRKLETYDEETHQRLKEEALSEGISVFHTELDEGHRVNGFTVAWRRCAEHRNGRMVEVAVSFCSKKDLFQKKYGNYSALCNFADGQTILLPVGSPNSESIVVMLRSMFILSSRNHWII